ncbi:MAG TPA: alpha/beta fold hydrolase [Mycobacteriales bacterium]|nr:alpha/beta fold hydrolase [Mycobacteriales bacterium]
MPEPGERLALTTVDGEHLAAVHLAGPDRELAIVVGHGFSGSIRRPSVRTIAECFAVHAGVLAFDFRGHGASTGYSTVGDKEVFDLDAAVSAARGLGYRAVASCGFSMGASVVIRHAALHGGVAAVAAVSGTSRWFYRGTPPMRRLHWVVERRAGRFLARRVLHTRIAAGGWDPVPEAPVEVVARIAPVPLLVVHGDRDAYFPVEHAEALAAAAGEPVELWIVPGFGHAEAAATPELLDRIGGWLRAASTANAARPAKPGTA